MAYRVPALVFVALALAAASAARGEEPPSDSLSSYLVDVAPGAISASSLVGLSASAIAQIQTSQDIVLAASPGGPADAKNGFGLAVTPARTTFMPMSGEAYTKSRLMRVLGSLTLSYAEAGAEISGSDYKKSGYSIDAFYFFTESDDPVIAGYHAVSSCDERKAAQGRAADALRRGDQAAFAKAQAEAEAAVKKCVDDALSQARWNASRISLSAGEAWIRPEVSGSAKSTLGRSVALGVQLAMGEQGALNASVHAASRELDIRTLTGTQRHSSSSIVAVRYTYGTKDSDGDTKVLVEASNADRQEVTAANAVFKYAVGIDRRLAKGAWLELRAGKRRSLDSTDVETVSLFSLKLTPSTGLFK